MLVRRSTKKFMSLVREYLTANPPSAKEQDKPITRKRKRIEALPTIIQESARIVKADDEPAPLRRSERIKRVKAETPIETKVKTKEVKLLNNFKQGDVLFGFRDTRKSTIATLKKRGFTKVIANELNYPAVLLTVDPDDSTVKGRKSSCEKHYEFLQNNKAYLTRSGGKPLENSKLKLHVSAAYRRACKLLLISRHAERTHKAHFVTTKINWKRVCTKKKSDSTTCFSPTCSEVRAAYRDFVRNGPNPHILFYDSKHNLMPQAPWEMETNKKLFEEYGKTFKK